MAKKLIDDLKIDDMIEVSVNVNNEVIVNSYSFNEEVRRVICRVLTFCKGTNKDILIEIDPSHDCKSWKYGEGYPEGFEKPSEIIDDKSCWWISRESFHRIVSSREPVYEKKKEAGCKCARCKEFIQYAEPNQPDGTLICYSCRQNPWR